MKHLLRLLALLMLADKVWRHLLVVRFFRRPVPPATHDPALVSIIQPIPRESLMRHLGRRDQAVLYGLGLGPALFPLGLLIALLRRPSGGRLAYTLIYCGYSFAIFAHLNRAYLHGAAPWRGAAWVPAIQVIFPLQLLAALLSPQRIVWRGHVIQAEPGGRLRFLRRRPQ